MPDIMVSIPNSIENAGLPSPELYTFYKQLETRTFWLEGEINEYSSEIARQILIWNTEDKDAGLPREKRKPIRLVLFSPGGDLEVSKMLIDVIHLSETPIQGFALGVCGSGAAFMFLACHERYMTENAYFLFHQGSGSFGGSFQEVVSQIENYQVQIQELTEHVINNTNYTEEEVLENIVGEWYVHSEEALEKGVCHEIIKDLSKLV